MAAEVPATSSAVPLAVFGLLALVVFAFAWTSHDREAAALAARAALVQRGVAVIGRQGGTGVEWVYRSYPSERRAAACWTFAANRQGRRAEGRYCEGLHEAYVIWDEDRLAR